MSNYNLLKVFVILCFSTTSILGFEKIEWNLGNDLKINLAYQSLPENIEAQGTVLFLHGGPDLGDFDKSLGTQEGFFSDLSEKGYRVIAPHLPYSLLNKETIRYQDVINEISKLVKDQFPEQDMTLICHSYGAHLAGHTLLEGGALIDNIANWVVLGGTTHHGAGDLRRVGYLINSKLEELGVREQEEISWDEDSILEFSDNNFTKLRTLMALKENLDVFRKVPLEAAERLSLDKYKKVDIFDNTLINKELNDTFSAESIASKIEESKRFPVLIVHPIEDASVTVDVGYSFFNALKDNNWLAYLATNENSPHNWMKNPQKNDEPVSYKYFMDTIFEFLSNNRSTLALKSEKAKNQILSYLEKYPEANFVELYNRFHQNEDVWFYSFANDGSEKSISFLKDENLKRSLGISDTKEEIEVLGRLANNLFAKTTNQELLDLEDLVKNKLEGLERSKKWAYYSFLKEFIDKSR